MRDLMLYCWRSGEIEIGTHLPKGAIQLASGELRELERAVSATARLAYDGNTWLVPGVPEAESDDAALDATVAYHSHLTRTLQAEPAHA